MEIVQGGDPAAGAGADWRSLLQPEARSRIVTKIMETLKRHLPVTVPEGLSELQKIAVRFEEKIYAVATSQSDYLRKISLKMLSMENQHKTNTQENPQNGQIVQNQSPCYLASSGSTSHTGYPGAGGLKDELYQMNKTLKDQYLAGLGELHEISMKLYGIDVPTQEPKKVHQEMNFKLILEHSVDSVQLNKRLSLEDSIPMYKRQMTSILNSEEWKPEQTFEQSAGQAPSTSSGGVPVTHGMMSPERSNVKRLGPALEDDIHG